jgi:hypothetical protein
MNLMTFSGMMKTMVKPLKKQYKQPKMPKKKRKKRLLQISLAMLEVKPLDD